jgi:hypothetical protein
MTKRTYRAVIWEKAEHWTFEATEQAADEAAAWAFFRKAWPARHYVVRSVGCYHADNAGAIDGDGE